MAKRSLLLVDGDTGSLRVLEVSLKKAGFNVTTASNGPTALEIVSASSPDLIIANTVLGVSGHGPSNGTPLMTGFDFCSAVKERPTLATIPFVFLTDQTEIEHKIRGLELGVDEYLIKPIYIKEILTRVRILLQKHDRGAIEGRRGSNTRFTGKLSDMGVVDLIQTVEVSSKSGVSHFTAPNGQGASLYFRDGSVIDAELGQLNGSEAVFRLLTWNEGEFEVLFRSVRRRAVINLSPQALLMEGMRRLDEWGRILEQLPPLSSRFEVAYAELAERLAELPDELNQLLRLFDGHRSLMDIVDQTPQGDLESLELIAKLFFEGLIVESTLDEPSVDTWPPPVAGREAPIDLPPARVRHASPSELEHDPGDEVYESGPINTVSTEDVVAASSSITIRPPRRKSLVDVALDEVLPVFPDLNSLPTSRSHAIVSPPADLEVEPSFKPEPERVKKRKTDTLPPPTVLLPPAAQTQPISVASGTPQGVPVPIIDEPVVALPSSPLASESAAALPTKPTKPSEDTESSDRELGKVSTNRRSIPMLPALVERVRNMGRRVEVPQAERALGSDSDEFDDQKTPIVSLPVELFEDQKTPVISISAEALALEVEAARNRRASEQAQKSNELAHDSKPRVPPKAESARAGSVSSGPPPLPTQQLKRLPSSSPSRAKSESPSPPPPLGARKKTLTSEPPPIPTTDAKGAGNPSKTRRHRPSTERDLPLSLVGASADDNRPKSQEPFNESSLHPPVTADVENTPVIQAASKDFPVFDDDATPLPNLEEPLPPAAFPEESAIDARVISSDGAEIVAVAGAISAIGSGAIKRKRAKGSVVIDDQELLDDEEAIAQLEEREKRSPTEEPTIEEPLGQRARRASPSPTANIQPTPDDDRRSQLPLFFAVAAAALVIGALLMLTREPKSKGAEQLDLSVTPLLLIDASSTNIPTHVAPTLVDAGLAMIVAFDASPAIHDASPVVIIDATPAAVDPAALKRAEATALERKARDLKRRGESRDALVAINQAITLRPTARYYATRADLLLAIGEREQAISAANTAISKSSRSAQAWMIKGLAHHELRQLGAAKAAFKRYLELRPTGADADDIRSFLDNL